MEIPLANCFSLGQALRDEDTETFLEQYDTLLKTLDHSIQLTTAKECARQISELPKEEFTLLQVALGHSCPPTNDHTQISTEEPVVVQLSAILEELTCIDSGVASEMTCTDSGTVSDLESSSTPHTELFSEGSSTHLVEEDAQLNQKDTPTLLNKQADTAEWKAVPPRPAVSDSLSTPLPQESTSGPTHLSYIATPPNTPTTKCPITSQETTPTTNPAVSSQETTSTTEPAVTSQETTPTTEPAVTSQETTPTTEPAVTPQETTTELACSTLSATPKNCRVDAQPLAEDMPISPSTTKTCQRVKQLTQPKYRGCSSPANEYHRSQGAWQSRGQARGSQGWRRNGWRKGGRWRGRGRPTRSGVGWRDFPHPPVTYNHAEVASFLLKGWQSAQKELMSTR